MKKIVVDMRNNLLSNTPLVVQITNYVTVNDCANITICAGGSPIMNDEVKDIEDLVPLASSLILNLGTLNERTVDTMVVAGKIANEKNIPVILDPVGYGASKYRTDSVERILKEVKVAVIKGNAGEIGLMAGTGGEMRGVDSVGDTTDPVNTVKSLSQRTGAVVAMSGPVDYVSDGQKTVVLSNGNDYLGTVTGTGCMLCSVVGCYVGANGASVDSLVSAITVYNVSAEKAAVNAKGPGSFKVNLLDNIYGLTDGDIMTMMNVEVAE